MDGISPHSTEAEEGFLSAVLLAGTDAVETGLDAGLEVTDFYRKEHGVIWASAVKLHDERRPIDMVTLVERVEKEGRWPSNDIGVASFLAAISGKAPTYANAGYYARVIKEKSLRRGLLMAAATISQLGYDEQNDIETTFDRAEAALKRTKDKAPATGRNPEPGDIIARMEGEKRSGIPTRWPALNAVSSGLVRGHIWVIGGFSSTGKSAVMVNLLEDVMLKGGSAMVASTEMSQEQYMLRALSLTSGVPQRVIRHGGMDMEQQAAYQTARDFWKTSKIRVFDDLYNATRIGRRAKRVREQLGDLDVLFVDFLQNLSDTGDEVKDARMSAIQLQALAKDLNCCVVALSQISNAQAMQQQETGSFGNYYAFKGSGAIKDAADLAIMLDRDRVNKPDVMWFNVVKNRHDGITRFASRFHLETGRLTQMTTEEMLDADPNSGRKSKRRRDDDD